MTSTAWEANADTEPGVRSELRKDPVIEPAGVGAGNEQHPLPRRAAVPALFRCAGAWIRLVIQRRIHLRSENVGLRLSFGDGTSARVYRETVVDGTTRDPCVLVVRFRLRGVRGWAHALFRWEILFNTPLFVVFPGFVSKLWVAHDERGRYRGIYQWDGADRAEGYARALWRVLELVSVPRSIQYVVLPGLRRDEFIAGSRTPDSAARKSTDAWWRPTARAAAQQALYADSENR